MANPSIAVDITSDIASFERKLLSDLQRLAARATVNVNVVADVTKARAEIESLTGQEVIIHAVLDAAGIRAELEALTAGHEIPIGVAADGIDAVAAQVNDLAGGVTVPVETTGDGLDAATSAVFDLGQGVTVPIDAPFDMIEAALAMVEEIGRGTTVPIDVAADGIDAALAALHEMAAGITIPIDVAADGLDAVQAQLGDLGGGAGGPAAQGGDAMAAGVIGGMSKGILARSALVAGAYKTAGIFGDAVSAGIEFETNLNRTAAALNLTKQQTRGLAEQALALGENYKLPATTAGEAARAAQKFAFAGIDVTKADNEQYKANEALVQAMKLRIIAEEDVDTATDQIIQTMKTFQLEGKDMAAVVTAIGGTAVVSTASANDLAVAMKYSSGAIATMQAKSMGAIPALKEQVAFLGLMADRGLAASTAGTGLNRFLEETTGKTKAAAKGIKDLTDRYVAMNGPLKGGGDIFFDNAGKARSLEEQFTNLKKSMEGMTQEQINASKAQLTSVGPIKDLNSALASLTAEERKSMEGMTDLEKRHATQAIFHANAQRIVDRALNITAAQWEKAKKGAEDYEATQRLVEAASKGLKGGLDAVSSSFETLVGRLILAVSPSVTGALQGFAGVISGVPAAIRDASAAVSSFLATPFATTVLDGLSAAFNTVKDGLGWVIDHITGTEFQTGITVVATFLGVLATSVLAVTTVTKLWALAQAAVNLVMSANPILLAVAAIAALAAGIAYAYTHSQAFHDFVDKYILPVLHAVADFVMQTVVPALQSIATWVMTSGIPALQQLWAWINEHILPIFEAIGRFIWEKVIPALGAVVAFVVQHWPEIMAVFTAFYNHIKTQVEGVIAIVGGIITFVKSVFTGQWSEAWNAVKKIFGGIWDALVGDVPKYLVAIGKHVIDYATKSLPGDLLHWTAEFLNWIGHLPFVVGEQLLKTGAGILDYATKPGGLIDDLLHWTGQFVKWVAGLPLAIASGIAKLAATIFKAIYDAVVDAVKKAWAAANPFDGSQDPTTVGKINSLGVIGPGIGGTGTGTGGTVDKETRDAAQGIVNAGMEKFRRAISSIESGSPAGNYTAQAPNSSASGRYQVLKGTWGGFMGYPTAKSAPPAVQDKFFDQTFGGYVKKFGEKLAAVAWFQGPGVAAGKAKAIVDANGTTTAAYLGKYLKQLGMPVPTGGGTPTKTPAKEGADAGAAAATTATKSWGDIVGNAIGSAVDQFGNSTDDVAGAVSSVGSSVDGVAEQVGLLGQSMMGEAARAGLPDNYDSIVSDIVSGVTAVGDGVGTTDGSPLGAATSDLITALNNLTLALGGTISDVAGAIDRVSGSIDGVSAAVDEVGAATSVIGGVLGSPGQAGSGSNTVIAAVNSVADKVSVIGGVLGSPGQAGSGSNTVISAVNSVADQVRGVGGVLGSPGQAGSGGGGSVISALQAVAGAVSSVGTSVAFVASRFNVMTGSPGQAGSGSFASFARGGVVDRATWGVFGEAGKELLLPLERMADAKKLLSRPDVRPLVLEALGANDAGGTHHHYERLPQTLDVEQLADAIDFRARSRGGSRLSSPHLGG